MLRILYGHKAHLKLEFTPHSSYCESWEPHLCEISNLPERHPMISDTRRLLMSALVLIGSALLSNETVAQRPCVDAGRYSHVGSNGYYGFGNLFEMPYATDRIPTPPFFAIHPPVHYSHAVPRTYGYSPFAYPGMFATPEVITQKPLEMINPHAEQEEEELPQAEETSHSITSISVIVFNPFVQQTNEDIDSELPTIQVARSSQ